MTSRYVGLILHTPKVCCYMASKPMLGATKAAALVSKDMPGYMGKARSLVITARLTPMEMHQAQSSLEAIGTSFACSPPWHLKDFAGPI